MKNPNRRIAALSLFSPLLTSKAWAQEAFPSRPVRIVVPFAPGGASDTVTRVLGEELGRKWNQSVVIENKPGGNTVIATTQVARSAPDGHSILLATLAWVTNPLMEKSLPYASDSLVPAGVIGYQPHVLYLNNAIQARNVRELAQHVKRSGKPLSIGNAGTGSSPHLAAVDFASRSGIPVLHVPYKGMSAALTDAMGGQVDAFFEGPIYRQIAQSGKINGFLVAQDTRIASWPELASAPDAGLKGFTSSAWFALLVPSATPKPVLAALSSSIIAGLSSPEVSKKLLDNGIIPTPLSSAESAAFVDAQRRRLAPIIVINRIATE